MGNTSIIEMRFICPSCGSTHWGGNHIDACCHGAGGCRFIWLRKDDWKHFVRVTRYENFEAHQQDLPVITN